MGNAKGMPRQRGNNVFLGQEIKTERLQPLPIFVHMLLNEFSV
ncbi:hypothetical protein HMPREF0021_00718 [Acinetobacter baumannii 6013150]|nr:hypothetical protein HMPREF0021_00718 [Acinetobacter baumannii 6013150]